MAEPISQEEFLSLFGREGGSSPSSPPVPQAGPKRISQEDLIGLMKQPSGQQIGGGTEPDVPPQQTPEGHVGQRFLSSLNTEIADTLGIPADVMAWVTQNAAWKSMTPEEQEVIRQSDPEVARHAEQANVNSDKIREYVGSQGIRDLMSKQVPGLEGRMIHPELGEARTTGQRMAEAGGRGAGMALTLGLGAGQALKQAWTESDSLIAHITRSATGAPQALASIGAGGAATGEFLKEQVPDYLKPTADIVGNLLGGGLAAGAESAVTQGFKFLGRHLGSIFVPAEEKAAGRILSSAENPEQLRTDLKNAPDNNLTVGQQTGDLGVLQLEKRLGGTAEGAQKLTQNRAEQNRAALDELGQLAPEQRGPAVTQYVRERLAQIEREHEAEAAAERDRVAGSMRSAGGTMFSDAAAYGDALRTNMSVRQNMADADYKALIDSIPDDVSFPTQGLKSAFSDISAGILKAAPRPKGEEAAIAKVVEEFGSSESVKELAALRQRVVAAERQATGETADRLTRMRQATDDAIAELAGNEAAGPGGDVMLSSLRAEAENFAARFRGGTEAGAEGARVAANDQGAVPPAPGEEGAAGGGPGAAPGGTSPGGTGRVEVGPPANEATSPQREALAEAERRADAAYKADRSEENLDRLVAAKNDLLRYDRDSTGAQKRSQRVAAGRTIQQAAEGADRTAEELGGRNFASVLAKDGENFRMDSRAVADRLFDSPDRLRAFMESSPGEASRQTMEDYAAFSMRQAAAKDGVISPKKLQEWIDSHGYVFEHFPDLMAKFRNVQAAQESLDSTMERQAASLEAFRTSEVTRLAGGANAEDVVSRALGSREAWGNLVGLFRGSPRNMEDLKQVVMRWMVDRSMTSREAATSGLEQINGNLLKDLVKRHRDSLAMIFSPAEMANIERVAMELSMANRTAATKTGTSGGSGLQHLLLRVGGRLAGMAMLGAEAGAMLHGHPFSGAGLVGAAGGVAVDHWMATRAARIDQLAMDMLLDKRMADVWLSRASARQAASDGYMATLARRDRAVRANAIANSMAAAAAGTQ